MSEAFDPYRIWLGIPPEEQPPDHYRLLGISARESDLDVIENAANRQMAHVRTFQSGQHGALSQRILNELSAAKICLLHPDRKRLYDRDLPPGAVRKLSVAVPPSPPLLSEKVDAPTPKPSEDSAAIPKINLDQVPQRSVAATGRGNRRKHKSRSSWPLILGMIVILVALGAAIVVWNRRENQRIREHNRKTTAVVRTPSEIWPVGGRNGSQSRRFLHPPEILSTLRLGFGQFE